MCASSIHAVPTADIRNGSQSSLWEQREGCQGVLGRHLQVIAGVKDGTYQPPGSGQRLLIMIGAELVDSEVSGLCIAM